MTLADVLNTDVEVVAARARAGLAWWVRELAEMLPPPLRRLAGGRPALAAERAADGGYRFTRDGRPCAAPSRRRPRVTLMLPAGRVLLRAVEAPPVSERDARRLIALDIDRLTPFPAAAVFSAVDTSRPAAADGRSRLILAVARREAVVEALDAAAAAGLDVRALSVGGAAGRDLELDFMPDVQDALGRRSGSAPALWIAVAALVLANIGLAIGEDMHAVARLRAANAAREATAGRASRLRARVEAEAARRAVLVEARAAGEPLRLLNALTADVPAGAWVERLGWNGRAARLSGYRRTGVDVAAALRADPVFTQVRNTSAETVPPSGGAAAGEPFDVTAQVAPADTVTRRRP